MSFAVKLLTSNEKLKAPEDAYLITPPVCNFDLQGCLLIDGTETEEPVSCIGYYGKERGRTSYAVWAQWLEDLRYVNKIQTRWNVIIDYLMSRCCSKNSCANGRSTPSDKARFERNLSTCVYYESSECDNFCRQVQTIFARLARDHIGRFYALYRLRYMPISQIFLLIEERLNMLDKSAYTEYFKEPRSALEKLSLRKEELSLLFETVQVEVLLDSKYVKEINSFEVEDLPAKSFRS